VVHAAVAVDQQDLDAAQVRLEPRTWAWPAYHALMFVSAGIRASADTRRRRG
jgi:hypothetical protein